MRQVVSVGICKFFKYLKDGKSRKYPQESSSLCRAVKALPNDGRRQGRNGKRGRKGARCERRQNIRKHAMKHCMSYCLTRLFRKILRKSARRKAFLPAMIVQSQVTLKITPPAGEKIEGLQGMLLVI